MATKPTALTLFAIDTNYSTGPLVGQPTKIIPIAPEAQEGWKPEQPAMVQWHNYLFNEWTVWHDWVKEGSFNPLEDAHIVETNGAGSVSISAGTFGNTSAALSSIRALPNNPGLTAAIFATAGFSQPAIKASSSESAVPAILVEATHAVSTTPAMKIDAEIAGGTGRALHVHGSEGNGSAMLVDFTPGTGGNGTAIEARAGDATEVQSGGTGVFCVGGFPNGANRGGSGLIATANDNEQHAAQFLKTSALAQKAAIYSEANNFAFCIDAKNTGGHVPAVRIESASVNPGDEMGPLQLVPQANHPTSIFAVNYEGLRWTYGVDVGNGVKTRPCIQTESGKGWITHSTEPSCGLFFRSIGIANTSQTSDIWSTIGTSFNFENFGKSPLETGTVQLILHFSKKRSAAGSDIPEIAGYEVRLIDITNAAAQMFLIQPDLVISGGIIAEAIKTETYHVADYVLPGAGERFFRVEHRKRGSADATVMSVTELTVEIRPKGRT